MFYLLVVSPWLQHLVAISSTLLCHALLATLSYLLYFLFFTAFSCNIVVAALFYYFMSQLYLFCCLYLFYPFLVFVLLYFVLLYLFWAPSLRLYYALVYICLSLYFISVIYGLGLHIFSLYDFVLVAHFHPFFVIFFCC